MHFTKEHIIELLNRVSIFASENLEEIKEIGIDVNDELDSTYIGIIIRQYAIVNDLKILFSKKSNGYLTSEFILFRSIVDDFIHFTYIINQPDKDEQIVKLNADAINKNFNKLMELAKINEEKLGGEYPFYPTFKLLEEVKEKVKQSKKRQQHFIDKDNFKFKSFKTTGNLIRDLEENDYYHSLIRAYFIWRKYSDFVHYSNFAYEEEQSINPNEDITYTEFAEIIFYSYKTVLNCLNHFFKKYGVNIIDSNNLSDYYETAGH